MEKVIQVGSLGLTVYSVQTLRIPLYKLVEGALPCRKDKHNFINLMLSSWRWIDCEWGMFLMFLTKAISHISGLQKYLVLS